MSLISFTPLADGVTAVNAAATNTPLSTIYNDYNGNITDANIASNAAIAGSKISYASVSNPYKFSAYLNSAQTPAGSTKIHLDAENYDTGSNFDSTTNYRFTAPISGFYHFNGALNQLIGNGSQTQCALYKNGSLVKHGSGPIFNNSGGNQSMGTQVSADLQLAANDYIELYADGATTAAANTGAIYTYLNGHLISAT